MEKDRTLIQDLLEQLSGPMMFIETQETDCREGMCRWLGEGPWACCLLARGGTLGQGSPFSSSARPLPFLRLDWNIWRLCYYLRCISQYKVECTYRLLKSMLFMELYFSEQCRASSLVGTWEAVGRAAFASIEEGCRPGAVSRWAPQGQPWWHMESKQT